jgi:o-succinylbenzoate synthase
MDEVVDSTLFRFALPLLRTVQLGPVRLSHREGLLLRLRRRGGGIGWGEVAPLPGFSRETMAEALTELQQWRTAGHPEVYVFESRATTHGVEQALEESLGQTASEWRHSWVYLNALVTGSEDQVVEQTETAVARGYRAVKLKVGGRAPDEDARMVRRVAAITGSVATLRLDANRAWTLNEAKTFLDGVGDLAIEYIEEPLHDPASLFELAAIFPVPLALDETLREDPARWRDLLAVASAVVLKPMLMGGSVATLAVAAEAVGHGAKPVLSSAFESGVGMRTLVRMATKAPFAGIPSGLDTYNLLADDVLSKRLPIRGPGFDAEQMLATPATIDEERLTEVR